MLPAPVELSVSKQDLDKIGHCVLWTYFIGFAVDYCILNDEIALGSFSGHHGSHYLMAWQFITDQGTVFLLEFGQDVIDKHTGIGLSRLTHKYCM